MSAQLAGMLGGNQDGEGKELNCQLSQVVSCSLYYFCHSNDKGPFRRICYLIAYFKTESLDREQST